MTTAEEQADQENDAGDPEFPKQPKHPSLYFFEHLSTSPTTIADFLSTGGCEKLEISKIFAAFSVERFCLSLNTTDHTNFLLRKERRKTKLKAITGILITLLLASTLGIMTPNISANANKAKWTFMVYVDADNNLDPYGLADINELEMVGSTKDVNVVAMLDRLEEEGSWIYYIKKDDNPDEITSPTVAEWGEVNMGDPIILKRFVKYCVDNYRAERYILVLWDHGYAFLGVCWDEHTGVLNLAEDHLTHEEIVKALSDFDLEVLAFDACIQAYIEVAYEYYVAKTDIEYLVVSEGIVGSNGFPYDKILGELTKNPGIPTEDLCVFWVDAYADFYSDANVEYAAVICGTLSVIKMNMMGEVVNGLRTLTDALEVALHQHWEATHELVGEARGEGMIPGFGLYGWSALIDLVSFVKYLSPYFEEATTLRNILQSAVVHVGNTNPMEAGGCGGLGIFFPASYHSFVHNFWWWVGWGEYYEDTKFAAEGWMDFLYAFYGDYPG